MRKRVLWELGTTVTIMLLFIEFFMILFFGAPWYMVVILAVTCIIAVYFASTPVPREYYPLRKEAYEICRMARDRCLEATGDEHSCDSLYRECLLDRSVLSSVIDELFSEDDEAL